MEDIFCINDFNDDPCEVWPTESVALTIQAYIKKVNAAAVFTFDKRGVSGHLNHIAAYSGAK